MTSDILLRYFKLLRTFRNGWSMIRTLRRGPLCTEAILWDGTIIRHPARPGLVETVCEIWMDGAYSGGSEPQPRDVVVDAGANIGLFSLLMARRGCRVLAFEPFPENFEYLERNVLGLKVETHKAALGGISGRGMMVSGGERSLDHRLVTSSTGETPIVSLDEVIELAGGQIDFLKMDIEGAEADVFATVTPEILSKIDRLVIEYHDNIRPGTLALLKDKLAATHDCEVVATAYDCGILKASKR